MLADATSAYAGNTPVAVPLPPLPEQKPLRKARPSEMRPSPIRPFANSSPVILRRQPLIRPSSKLGLGDEIGLLDELSGWIRCFWVVGFLLNPVGRAFPVDVTGGGQGRAL